MSWRRRQAQMRERRQIQREVAAAREVGHESQKPLLILPGVTFAEAAQGLAAGLEALREAETTAHDPQEPPT